MNLTPPTPAKGLQVSTPTDTTIVLTRTFNAPRRLVWEAFFVPDKMRRWMLPPPGLTMTVCECEARVGGALRLAWKNEEADPFMTLQGVFTEVTSPERATHTETMALGSGQTVGSQLETHEFAEAVGMGGMGGVTSMRITQVYDSKDARDGALASGMDEGMECCYKQLDAVLAQPA
jgi:uncharacterized protein YndB with AHSA1/START domain